MSAKQFRFNASVASAGFSLVEVVLALAVVAVGLITIIGLFPQGLSSARRAMDDSLSAMVAQDVIAERRILIQNGGATIGNTTAEPPRWYAAEGTNLLGAASSANAMYKCEIVATLINPNLEETQVCIYWPWYSTATTTKTPPPANTNIFVTRIARY